MKKGADSARVAYPLFQEGDGGSIPTSALQLIVFPVDMGQAQKLNRMWHSVLPETDLGNLLRNARSVAFVAEFQNVRYACGIWTTPIAANRMKNGFDWLELRRFAIAPDAPKNTASRVLSVMVRLIRKRWPELIGLVSYQAVAHHTGTIYKAAGWVATNKSKASTWHPGERRAEMQTQSDKIRWELRF